jgi:hypothetical protein
VLVLKRNVEGQPHGGDVTGKVALPAYAYPWPDEIPGLGPRRVDAFDHCVLCGAGSWVRYGVTVLCLTCARRRARSMP